MRPHTPYLRSVEGLFGDLSLHGMAHITGGGIEGNLKRILPRVVDADIDVGSLRVPPIFSAIREEGRVAEADMLRTFNVGAGLLLVVDASAARRVAEHVETSGVRCYAVGAVVPGTGRVRLRGSLAWSS
jgi:phosphoribosylformylglycinamidine cyclo-ligase